MAFGVEPINPNFNMYNVKLYLNTGFDVVNIPENPTVLNNASSTVLTLPSIDIYQEYQLSGVSVRVDDSNRSRAVLADYIQIGDAYYAVTGYQFTSYDVLQFGLYFEALLSARAKGAITSIGGTTVRRRVTESEDTFGAYTDNDELMSPQKPLKLIVGKPLFQKTNDYEWIVINSSIDLKALEDNSTENTLVGKTFTDSTSGESVTTPYTSPVTTPTNYKCGDTDLADDGNELFRSSWVQNAVGISRSLGVESAIIKQFKLPASLVSIDLTDITANISTITGIDKSVDSGLVTNYASVRNKKLLYGAFNKFGLLSSAGNKCEFNPEEIVSSESENPTVRIMVDPRPDGAPYFRFTKYLGDSSDAFFFSNCIKGLGWQEAPLIYTSPSNSWLNNYNFESQRYEDYGTQSWNQTYGHLKSNIEGAENIAGGVGSILSGDIGEGIKNIIGGVAGNVNSRLELQQSQWQFEQAKNRELQNFAFSQSAVVPQISFPLQADLIRDIVGNSVVPYRYEYDPSDINRIDTLLTMYGYKETEPFKAAMLLDHKDFEYLQLSGVSIQANSIPMWWRNQVANELNTGIRIWHVKPDFGYYDGSKTVE